jgi:hypothetical protein
VDIVTGSDVNRNVPFAALATLRLRILCFAGDFGTKDWILPSISADRRTIVARGCFMATAKTFGDGIRNQSIDR